MEAKPDFDEHEGRIRPAKIVSVFAVEPDAIVRKMHYIRD
jgi:hypothetical protein